MIIGASVLNVCPLGHWYFCLSAIINPVKATLTENKVALFDYAIGQLRGAM